MVFVLPLSVYASSDLDKSSYELFYPIVAGKVPGDKWYGLKMLREKVVLFFLFNSEKKVEYHTSLSKKRLVEAEKLIIVNKNYKLGVDTLKKSIDELEEALKITPDNIDRATIIAFMIKLADQMPEGEKNQVKSFSILKK